MRNEKKIRRIIFGGWACFIVLVCLLADDTDMPMSLAICGIFLLLIGTICFICEKFAPLPIRAAR